VTLVAGMPTGGSASPAVRRAAPPSTNAHERFRASVRAFVAGELAPHADAWEAAGSFPDSVFVTLGQRGYLGLRFASEDGGAEDPLAAAVFVEELAHCGSGGVAAGIGAHCGIALAPIASFGTPAQKARYLAPGLRGERIAALAITEPGAGSDVASIATTAQAVEGGWLVSGAKQFITGGVRAQTLVSAVKTSSAGGHHGLSFLIIDAGPGVAGIDARPISKLGWHASDTALIGFHEVFVPRENLLGEEHGGFALIMANFQWERLLLALGAVGAMQWCLEATSALADSPWARQALAEMAVTLEAARAVTYGALATFVAGGDALLQVTAAKLLTQRAAVEVADGCLQIHGLAGYHTPGGIERALRDARLGPIGGGTDEIMKEILGRSLGIELRGP
jgi:acyl-CoA dehydrogenase